MQPREVLNSYLDKLACTRVRVMRRSYCAFRVCGATGMALASALTLWMASHLGLSSRMMMGIIVAALFTFFGLAMAIKVVTGGERLIFYRYLIAVLGVVAGLLWLLREPVLAYLDVTALGVGIFLACGRVGCLMVGCCHGRLSGWGICYGAEHGAAGFNRHYIGARFFPVQALESAWAFGFVIAGSICLMSGSPAGTALTLFVVAYAVGRFSIEFMRGDPERFFTGGFSEAQWTSLLLTCAVTGAELCGVLPFRAWHIAATAGLACAILMVTLRRRFEKTSKHLLLHPQHVRDVAAVVELVSGPASENSRLMGRGPRSAVRDSNSEEILVGSTRLGIQISAGKIDNPAGCIEHYAISSQNGVMTEYTARTLAELIRQLKYSSGSLELIKGDRGVFHFLMRDACRTQN